MRTRLNRLLFGLAFLAVLTFLFVKTQSVDLDRHNGVVDTLRQAKQLEAALNEDILRSRFALLAHYDPLVRTLAELRTRENSLWTGPHAIYPLGRTDINERLDAYRKRLTEQEDLLDRFKSEAAIFKNSLAYFPVASEELAAVARRRGQARELTPVLHDLVREVLVFNLNGSAEHRRAIERLTGALRASGHDSGAEVVRALDNVVAHAKMTVRKKDEVDGLLARLVSLPGATQIDEIANAYNAYYDGILRQTNAYRFGLYLFAVALFLYLAYILLKLERSNGELRQQAAEQRGLFEIGQLLASTLDRQQVLDRLAEITHSLLGVDVLRIWLRDEQADSLVLYSQAGTMRGDVQQQLGFTPGQGLVGCVLAEGRPLVLSDLRGDARVKNRAWFEAEGFCSFLGVPLVIENTQVGVLVCLTRSRRDWSQREVALAETLAVSSSAAIRNARVYEEAQARSSTMRQVAVLSNLVASSLDLQRVLDGVAEAALALLKGDRATLWLVHEEADIIRLAAQKARDGDVELGHVTTEFPRHQGMVGWVIEGNRKHYSPNLLEDPRLLDREWVRANGYASAIIVPLVVGERALGAISVLTKTPRQFSPADEELLEIFAANAATAVENARLFERAQQAYVELARTQEQLVHAQKMEAVGRLAGGIAHDFNNLLTVIIGRSYLMRSRLRPGDPICRDVELVEKTAQRATALTTQLLAFSRKQILQPRVLDLNAVVAGTVTMLRPLVGEDVDLVFVPGPGLGRVKADLGQLEQVIANLAVNARDAMPGGGRLTLETGNVELDEAYARGHIGVQPGRYVMLAVSDTGTGMDAATRSRIFEPFFTTKEPGKGTGLGLSTVYGIVTQSGGNVEVYSEPGRGTTFKIRLGRIDDPVDAPDAGAAESAPTGSETILLVEDEEEVRDLAREFLEASGYTVLNAHDAGEALTMAERHADPIHLLLSDVVMPQMSGREVAGRLAVTRPDTKVLYMSGYTDDAVVRHGALERGISFLQKPFTVYSLGRKVREVLDSHEEALATGERSRPR